MLSQILAVTGINVRSIPQRWAPSLVIVIGLAGVVAVFTALLAMASGFETTLKAAGRTDVAMVLRGGSDAEINSGLSREDIDIIKQAKGVRAAADGHPLGSAEMMIITELQRTANASDPANVTLRGIDPDGFVLRPQVKIIAGRTFTPGLREIIAGKGVTQQFAGAAMGKLVRMRGTDWKVVGVFESGDANESELWADLNIARSTFNRTGGSSVRLALEGPGGFDLVKGSLSSDPRLTVDVQREQDYYSAQSRDFRKTIGVLASVVTVIMGLGAIFAALNSMYAAVATRGKEIATLRALGFGSVAVVVSVLIEALLLAVAGGLLGALLAYLLFNNLTVSTLGQNFTQVVFNFRVTPELVARGLVISVVIGMLGGFFPAVRAARVPVTTGLREL